MKEYWKIVEIESVISWQEGMTMRKKKWETEKKIGKVKGEEWKWRMLKIEWVKSWKEWTEWEKKKLRDRKEYWKSEGKWRMKEDEECLNKIT